MTQRVHATGHVSRAPLGALCIFGVLFAGVAAGSDCPQASSGVLHQVREVTDGDTLVLRGGARLRLIGYDAPERAREERAAEALAEEAREHLARLVRNGGQRVRVVSGTEASDRHGRLLGHAFLVDGTDLSRTMLLGGYGTLLVVPPNSAAADCYRRAEAKARAERRGVWALPSHEPVEAADLAEAEHRPYRRVTGRVERVRVADRAAWLTLPGRVVLRIDPEAWRAAGGPDLRSLEGRRVEAGGRIYRHQREIRIALRHPSALTILAEP